MISSRIGIEPERKRRTRAFNTEADIAERRIRKKNEECTASKAEMKGKGNK